MCGGGGTAQLFGLWAMMNGPHNISRLAINGVLIEVRFMVMILVMRIGQGCLSVLDIRKQGGIGCSG